MYMYGKIESKITSHVVVFTSFSNGWTKKLLRTKSPPPPTSSTCVSYIIMQNKSDLNILRAFNVLPLVPMVVSTNVSHQYAQLTLGLPMAPLYRWRDWLPKNVQGSMVTNGTIGKLSNGTIGRTPKGANIVLTRLYSNRTHREVTVHE